MLAAAQSLAIIPLPNEIKLSKGYFLCPKSENENPIKSLESKSKIEYLKIRTYDTTLADEGYYLKIDTDKIYIKANTNQGIFYGKQTLLQIIRDTLLCAEIKDYPAFQYRGMHLDVCRHFFSKDFIKQYIDILAKNKMNVFHWHLTDDQGWRIEIKKYPLLTKIGASRIEEDGSTYKGFYTQEDIKEIVAYAQDRFVTIIPEIEMPGHSSAAIAAYPWLSCTEEKISVPTNFGIKKDIYCPSDTVFHFLENVLDEICTLFPGKLIHLGGDEVPKAQWRNSPIAQQLTSANHLKNEEELQYFFMSKMENYLLSKGKRSIGWGEVIRGGISDSMIVMSWLSKSAGIKAAKHGNDVIMAPRLWCYFDYPQSSKDPIKAIYMVNIPLQKVYKFSPLSSQLKNAEEKHILGGEATLWTEFYSTESQVLHQLLPRLNALSESLWTSPYQKNFQDFKVRLSHLKNIL